MHLSLRNISTVFVTLLLGLFIVTTITTGAAQTSSNRALVVTDGNGTNLGNLVTVSAIGSGNEQYVIYMPLIDAILRYEIQGNFQIVFPDGVDAIVYAQPNCQGTAYVATGDFNFQPQWIVKDSWISNSFYKIGATISTINVASARVNGVCTPQTLDPNNVRPLLPVTLGAAIQNPVLPLTITQ